MSAVSILGPGTSGYTAATNVDTDGSGGSQNGSGLTVDITVNGSGEVTVTVNNPGSGYLPGEDVIIIQPGSTDDVLEYQSMLLPATPTSLTLLQEETLTLSIVITKHMFGQRQGHTDTITTVVLHHETTCAKYITTV